MPKKIDILLNPDTGDILPEERVIIPTEPGPGDPDNPEEPQPVRYRLIEHGFHFGDATAQHQAILLYAQKGEFKEYPTLGVGLQDITADHDMVGWRREIRVQLEAIGMKVDEVTINTETQKLTLDASYDS